jgi:hypothetical protein
MRSCWLLFNLLLHKLLKPNTRIYNINVLLFRMIIYTRMPRF